MRSNNHKSFPRDFSDQEILRVIEQNTIDLQKNLMYSSTGIASPITFTSKIDLGYNELLKRNNERFLEQVIRLNKENEKSGKINFRLNIVTIILAICSIILSIASIIK